MGMPSATDTLMVNVFAYGTLQLPEVMFAVTGRKFRSQTARLKDFARYRLHGKSYPGIRPEFGATVGGLVYSGIDGQSLASLDAFEDVFYHRETVRVITPDGMAWEAETYVINEDSHGLLLPEAWNLEDFKCSQLSSFLLRHE